MMKSMGWDGGALGLRGEGIVEPIALPLDLKKGAGLGCEKEQTKRSKLPLTKPVMTNLPVNISRVIPPCNMSKMDFKMGILHTILNMVQEATPAIELPFNKKLTQKNWSFIRHAVISFNQKAKYMHNEPIFRDLGLRIVDKMSKNKYIITACWGVTKTNVLFALSKAIYEPSDLNSNEWCSIVNFDKPKISDNKSVNSNIDKPKISDNKLVNSNFDKPKTSDNKLVNSNFDKPKISDKSVNTQSSNVIVAGDAFRYYVLAQILEFCDVPSKSLLTKEIVLKEAMKQKQMNYIKDVIFRLNKKSKASSVLDDETAVFHDIIDAMKQFTLHVDFPFVKRANENKKLIYKTIRFHKILNILKTAKDTKRCTTFSSDTFDEKFMFDSQISIYNQNAPIPEQDVPKIVQDEPVIDLDAPKYADAPKVGQDPKHDHNEPKMHQDTPMYAQDVPKIAQDPKHDQNELKHDHDALKYDHDAPKIVQDAPQPDHNPQNHKQNAPKIVRNELNVVQTAPMIVQDAPTVGHAPKRYTPTNLPNLIDGVDCICCLLDDMKSNEENDEVKAVEYIFIEKETVESDIDGPIVTVTKDNEVTSNMTHDMNKKLTTIAYLNDEIKNLSINDNIDIENLVERPEETIYGLDFENIESPIRNIFKHKNLCKRPISNSSTPDRACKKGRYEHYFKKISITPKNYPQNEITNEVAAKFQKSILGSIDYTDDLPLLQCHGIEDGALVYSCHTEKSLNFILNVIKSLDLLFTASQEGEIVCHRMKVKIRSFIKESIDVIFDRLETYNINLDTRNWKVIDIERGRDFVIICMDVDESSYKMLLREKFTLYTGIDQAKFSLVWD